MAAPQTKHFRITSVVGSGKIVGRTPPIKMPSDTINWSKATKVEQPVDLESGGSSPGTIRVWTGFGIGLDKQPEDPNRTIAATILDNGHIIGHLPPTAVALACGHVVGEDIARATPLGVPPGICPICFLDLTCSRCSRYIKPAGLPPVEWPPNATSFDPFDETRQHVPLTMMEKSGASRALCFGCFQKELLEKIWPWVTKFPGGNSAAYKQAYSESLPAIVEMAIPTLEHYRSEFQKKTMQDLQWAFFRELSSGLFYMLSDTYWDIHWADWEVADDSPARLTELKADCQKYLTLLLTRVRGLHAWKAY